MARKRTGLRLLRGGLWLLVAWVLVRGVVSFLPAAEAGPAPAPPGADVPMREPDGLRAFPALFAREYLTWEAANPDERSARLGPYLARGLPGHAGWRGGNPGVAQRVEEAYVYGVRRVTETRWLVTVAARVTRTQEVDEAVAGSAVKRKALPGAVLYLAVPVGTAPAGGWVVYDYPSLLPEPPQPDFKEPVAYGKEQTDEGDRVRSLLAGFFRAYFHPRENDLTYFVSPGTAVRALEGTWTLDAVRQTTLLATGEGTWALAEVAALDTTTGGRYLFRYTVQLEERDGRWYVKELEQRGE